VETEKPIAVWALTPNGAKRAGDICRALPCARLFLSKGVAIPGDGATVFGRFSDALAQAFDRFSGHVCVMAAGIVVRSIAPVIRHKCMDPAVVVVDEGGRYAVSLLSGHIGGANRLARTVAAAIGAEPVITTATDANGVPAIDTLAAEMGLGIETPGAIKHVHMAFLRDEPVDCYDPMNLICAKLAGRAFPVSDPFGSRTPTGAAHCTRVGIFVSDTLAPAGERILVLRPKTLVAGVGCNRNTPMPEIKSFLFDVLCRFRFSPASLAALASIQVKADEAGLVELGRELALPLVFFEKDELAAVEGVQTPSRTVEKHVGVKSVCEAAAILAAGRGRLIVPKQASRNVTVALARKSSIF